MKTKIKQRGIFFLGIALAVGAAVSSGLIHNFVNVKEVGAASQTATLVTNVSQLSSGDSVVIISIDGTKSLSTTQNDNNRASAVVTADGSSLTFDDSTTEIITLGITNSHWTLYANTSPGYLYAASSSKNYLRTQSTNDANGEWTIELNENSEATIQAQGTNTRNLLRFNKSNNPPIFSCYGSGQELVKLFKIGSSTPATGVTIPATLSVYRGASSQIEPVFSPEGSSSPLTWTSSNEAVATVTSGGLVTGVAAGQSTIRAAISESIYDECVVTVSIPATTSIFASPSTLHMGIGASKTKTLVVSSLPVGSDNGATFDSDDYDVATVSAAGVVTGQSAGSATITVTSTANPSLIVYVTVNVYSNFYEMGHEGTATSDSGTTLTTGDIASNAAGHLTGDASSMVYTTVTSIYPALGKLKTGTSSANGVLAFNLPSGNNATKLIISASQYGSDTSTIAVNGGPAQTVTAGTTFNYYVFDISASNSVEIVFAKRVYFNAISIVYAIPAFGTLDSIAVNNPASDLSFEVGETFSSAGLTLTATDTLSNTMAVNDGFTTNYDGHVFVPGDVGSAVAVTVSYTHGAVTKTTSYNISVLAAAVYYHDFVPAEAVEFSYVSSSDNVTSTSEYKVLSGLAWNMVYTPQEGKNVSIGNYNGITFGSGTHPFATVAMKSGLLSVNGANKVTKVIVDISGNGSKAVGTVTVDVDGVALDYTDNAYAGAPDGRKEMVFTSSTGLFGHVNVVLHGTTAGAGLYGIKIFADTDTTDVGLATNFASAVEGTDSCGVSVESDVSALRAQYNALSSTAKNALSSINIYDFASGDTAHAGIQSVTFTAANKWAMLDAMYPEVPGSGLIANQSGTQSIYTIVLLAIGGMTIIGGMFFLKRKREE